MLDFLLFLCLQYLFFSFFHGITSFFNLASSFIFLLIATSSFSLFGVDFIVVALDLLWILECEPPSTFFTWTSTFFQIYLSSDFYPSFILTLFGSKFLNKILHKSFFFHVDFEYLYVVSIFYDTYFIFKGDLITFL